MTGLNFATYLLNLIFLVIKTCLKFQYPVLSKIPYFEYHRSLLIISVFMNSDVKQQNSEYSRILEYILKNKSSNNIIATIR